MSDAILINGVVYRRYLAGNSRRGFEWVYRRQSVPPDAMPGKRSRTRQSYKLHELPEHEEITVERAKEICAASVEVWAEKLRAHG